MSRMKLFLTFILLALSSGQSQARESLTYSSGLAERKDRQIYAFVQEQEIYPDVTSIELAKIDLNADGLAEYIARPARTACAQSQFCLYTLVVFKDRTPLLLNKIEAKNLMISTKKTYGIRDLIVYTNPQNDFQARIYSWNPFSFRFDPENP